MDNTNVKRHASLLYLVIPEAIAAGEAGRAEREVKVAGGWYAHLWSNPVARVQKHIGVLKPSPNALAFCTTPEADKEANVEM